MSRAAIVVALSGLALAGCAATFDVVYLVSKPPNVGRDTEPEAPIYRGPATSAHRYLEIEAGGALVCLDEEHRLEQVPVVTRATRPRNGYIPKAYAFTPIVDWLIVFPAVMYAAQYAFDKLDGGTVSTRSVLIATGVALADSGWATYRALTVEPTTLLKAELAYEQPQPRRVITLCPSGTEITLAREGGETLTLRFEDGRLAASVAGTLDAFVATASSVSIAGEGSVSVSVPILRDIARALASPAAAPLPRMRLEVR